MIEKHYIGIDPGAKGAIAVIDESGQVVNLYDMPIILKKIDKYELLSILEHCATNCKSFFMIERCQYTPAIKGMGAFTFGQAVMAVDMALAALGYKHDFVRPQKWKKEFELIKKDKKASIQKAKELFPGMKNKLLVSRDGRSEALLLAEYARRYF